MIFQNAKCTNTVGSYTCECLSGYVGSGRTCSDINECSTKTHNCGSGFGCKNTVGGFTCEDIDECSIKNECDINALCVNTNGSYSCKCETGFTGDGRSCVDINECSSNPCRSNEACQNSVGSYTCIPCRTGMKPSGSACVDINECSTGTHRCSRVSGAYLYTRTFTA